MQLLPNAYFALIAAPLFKLTRKDSGYKSGPLPEKTLKAFYILQKQLTSEPVMAFPKADQQYAIITDAATGIVDTPGGLGAILTQVDKLSRDLLCFKATQGPRSQLLPFLVGGCRCCLGNGLLQQIPEGKTIHTLHGSQATRETGSLTQ